MGRVVSDISKDCHYITCFMLRSHPRRLESSGFLNNGVGEHTQICTRPYARQFSFLISSVLFMALNSTVHGIQQYCMWHSQYRGTQIKYPSQKTIPEWVSIWVSPLLWIAPALSVVALCRLLRKLTAVGIGAALFVTQWHSSVFIPAMH